MEAIGLIETKGIVPAIIAADAMLKAANVGLLGKENVGGGLVTIVVEGDVGAVKASLEAGIGSVNEINNELLISQHIIARPQKGLSDVVLPSKPLKETKGKDESPIDSDSENVKTEDVKVAGEEKLKKVEKDILDEKKDLKNIDIEQVNNQESVEKLIIEYGADGLNYLLNQLRVVELRKLARKYDDFGIKGREVSNASKDTLIMEFKKYYTSNQ